MYYVIMGGGSIGEPLAISLVSAGHEVFVLDINPQRVEELYTLLGRVAAEGDGTRFAVLDAAGASRADVFIATTRSDADNLSACQLVKNAFNVERTVAVVNAQENVPVFKQGGVDVVVSGGDLVFTHLSSLMPAHPPLRLMPIPEYGQEIVGIKVPSTSAIIGQLLSTVDLPDTVKILLILSPSGEVRQFNADTMLHAEERVIALASSDMVAALSDVLTETDDT